MDDGRRHELGGTTMLMRHSQAAPVEDATVAVEPEKETNEALRRRLARLALDVHDGPMQELIALGYGLERLRATAIATSPGNGATLARELEHLHSRLAETEQMLREMIRALEDSASKTIETAETGGQEIIAIEVEAFRGRCPGVEIETRIVGDLELHTDSQRIALASVLRESLTNVAKHADADNVTVDVRGLSDVVTVQICDDGCGFEPTAAYAAGLGLAGMKNRLAMIDGQLIIESRRGGPTTVTATLHRWRPVTTIGETASTGDEPC